MRFVYIMDPMERLNYEKDTTVAFIKAAQDRGHESLHTRFTDMFVQDGDVHATVRPVKITNTAPFYTYGEPIDVRLADVAAVVIRKDPPFDAAYLYGTLMLERVRDRTVLMNDPRGLRDANEKLYAGHGARPRPPPGGHCTSLVTCRRRSWVRARRRSSSSQTASAPR
jgi:glutathione synthase